MNILLLALTLIIWAMAVPGLDLGNQIQVQYIMGPTPSSLSVMTRVSEEEPMRQAAVGMVTG